MLSKRWKAGALLKASSRETFVYVGGDDGTTSRRFGEKGGGGGQEKRSGKRYQGEENGYCQFNSPYKDRDI